MSRKSIRAAIGAIMTVLLSAIALLVWTGEPVISSRVTQVPPPVEAKVHDCEIHVVEIERLHWPCDAEVKAGCDPDVPIAYRREDVTSYPYCLRKSGMLRGRVPNDEVTVHCRRDGSVEVDAEAVVTHPEGVRVNLVLDAYRRTWIRGLRVEAKEPRTSVVSAAAPGWHLVGCSHPRVRAGEHPPRSLLLVVDPADFWIPPALLECRGGQAALFFGISRLGPGDPAEMMRERYDFIRRADEVVISGYKNGRDRRFHALRQGRAYFAVDLSQSENGWSIANSESCTDA